MTDILLKIGVVLALLVGLFFGEQHIEGIGKDKQSKIDQVVMDQIKLDAATTLVKETQRADAATAKMQAVTDAQNIKDQNHGITVKVLSDRLAAVTHADGRLRDPNAAGCGSSGGSAETQAPGSANLGGNDAAQTGGLLSVPLTELLKRALRESDEINVAYISCRSDAVSIRASDTP